VISTWIYVLAQILSLPNIDAKSGLNSSNCLGPSNSNALQSVSFQINKTGKFPANKTEHSHLHLMQ